MTSVPAARLTRLPALLATGALALVLASLLLPGDRVELPGRTMTGSVWEILRQVQPQPFGVLFVAWLGLATLWAWTGRLRWLWGLAVLASCYAITARIQARWAYAHTLWDGVDQDGNPTGGMAEAEPAWGLVVFSLGLLAMAVAAGVGLAEPWLTRRVARLRGGR